jgi:hypothetical protein
MRNPKRTIALAFLVFLAAAAAAQSRPVVAALEPRLRGLDAGLALQYADSLAGAFFRSGRADVVDPGQRGAALEELAFAASPAADADAAAAAELALGRQLAATHIAAGSLGRYEKAFVASLRLVETATGKVAGSVEEVYPSLDALLADADRIARALLDSAGFPPAQAAPAAEAAPAAVAADGADPIDALLAEASGDDWTALEVSLWAPLQLFPSRTAVRGLRLGLFYADNAAVYGLDLGLVNRVAGPMVGLQIALVPAAGALRGFQLGLVGFADRAELVQANVVYNQARVLGGLQLGLVNVVEKGVGMQAGLVNVAGLWRGLQLGLVNVVLYGERAGFMPFVNIKL